jgi:hypothetical protein
MRATSDFCSSNASRSDRIVSLPCACDSDRVVDAAVVVGVVAFVVVFGAAESATLPLARRGSSCETAASLAITPESARDADVLDLLLGDDCTLDCCGDDDTTLDRVDETECDVSSVSLALPSPKHVHQTAL